MNKSTGNGGKSKREKAAKQVLYSHRIVLSPKRNCHSNPDCWRASCCGFPHLLDRKSIQLGENGDPSGPAAQELVAAGDMGLDF